MSSFDAEKFVSDINASVRTHTAEGTIPRTLNVDVYAPIFQAAADELEKSGVETITQRGVLLKATLMIHDSLEAALQEGYPQTRTGNYNMAAIDHSQNLDALSETIEELNRIDGINH